MNESIKNIMDRSNDKEEDIYRKLKLKKMRTFIQTDINNQIQLQIKQES